MPKRTLPEPRDWLATDDPRAFGRNKPVRWQRPRGKADRALVAAAITQHEFAKAVRAHLRGTGTTTQTLADRAGLTIDQLRRILRGEVHLTLADMHLIAAHAGLRLPGGAPTDTSHP